MIKFRCKKRKVPRTCKEKTQSFTYVEGTKGKTYTACKNEQRTKTNMYNRKKKYEYVMRRKG